MTKPFILIIEDDPQIADIFLNVLEQTEFETEAVSNGADALARLAQLIPDIVILDLHLPEVSGERVLRHIRETTALTQTKIILITADVQMAKMMEAEADYVLLKPFRIAQLRSAIDGLHPNRNG
jgi:CheY-like chemotaxis protein